MGDAEDTFTKQEIQAGYVTSGRDVLARQQQIMAQQQAAAFGNSGGNSRKKVGGGGPSGTGKASASPVFPPPTFDEPLPKPKLAHQTSGVVRARSIGAAAPASIPVGPGAGAPSAASVVAGSHQPNLGTGASAATPAPHTTLTPLTPLTKRGSSVPVTAKNAAAGVPKPVGIVGTSTDLTPAESLALQEQRKEALAQQQKELALKMSKQSSESSGISSKASSSPSSVGSGAQKGEISGMRENGAANANANVNTNSGIIGGPPIGSIGAGVSGSNIDMGPPLIGSGFSGNLGASGAIDSIGSVGPSSTSFEFGSIGHATGSGILGGQPIGIKSSDDARNGVIGGTSLAPQSNPFNLDSLLLGTTNSSGGIDKWGAAAGGGNASQNNLFGGSGAFGLGAGGIWGGEESAPTQPMLRSAPAPIGPVSRNGGGSMGSDVGGTSLFSNNTGGGSSTLASMLGIQLPTGSGSLRESTPAFPVGQTVHAPIGGLNNVPSTNAPGAIGAKSSSMLPIGAPGSSQGGLAIGGYGGGVGVGGIGGGNSSDMALLQSLLPGVNITSGNAYRPAAPQQPVGVGSLNQGSRPIGSEKWNGGLNSNNVGSAQQEHPNQDQQRSGNIW